jgi:Fur family transcriptional regulator, ferric uptake regulator
MISVDRGEMEKALGELAATYDFSPDYGHLTVFGTCADCAAS